MLFIIENTLFFCVRTAVADVLPWHYFINVNSGIGFQALSGCINIEWLLKITSDEMWLSIDVVKDNVCQAIPESKLKSILRLILITLAENRY